MSEIGTLKISENASIEELMEFVDKISDDFVTDVKLNKGEVDITGRENMTLEESSGGVEDGSKES